MQEVVSYHLGLEQCEIQIQKYLQVETKLHCIS